MPNSDHQIGDYWYGIVNWEWHWLVRTRTGTFIRHCQKDAEQSGHNAAREAVKYNAKRQRSFQAQLETILDDMVEYYENDDDISDEAAMWARDWASLRSEARLDKVEGI